MILSPLARVAGLQEHCICVYMKINLLETDWFQINVDFFFLFFWFTKEAVSHRQLKSSL